MSAAARSHQSYPGAAGHLRTSLELGRRMPMACAAHFLGSIHNNKRTTG
jgi:hypothetical protein